MTKIFMLIAFLFATTAHGATYSYYFATGGIGTTCTDSEDPCDSLSDANTKIDALGSTDIAYLYFNRGDTWTCDTEALSTSSISCFQVISSNPTVHIDAYGTGANPIFDGLVTDFSAVDYHKINGGTQPVSYSRFFEFYGNDNCSMSNVEMKRIYGHAISLKDSHYFTLASSTIHDFGSSSITTGLNGLHDSTAEYNTIYNGQELYKNTKAASWGAGIQFAVESASGETYDNTIRYNTIYDIYGECMIAPGSTIEYNVIGSCGSAAFYAIPLDQDLHNTIVRYNYAVYEDYAETVYDSHSGGMRACLAVVDEAQGGNNNAASLEIYGDICINYDRGISITCVDVDIVGGPQCDADAKIGSVEIYDNLIIDPQSYGVWCSLVDGSITDDLSFYNNSIQVYDNSPTAIIDDRATGIPAGWGAGITGNHYWVEGGIVEADVDSDWRASYNITDPELLGEPTTAWNGQTGATYYIDIQPDDDISPASGSPVYELNDIMSWSTDEILAGEEDTSPGGDPGLPTEFTQTGTTSFTQTGTVEFTQVSAYSYLGYSNDNGTPATPTGTWTAFGSASMDLVHVWKADTDTHNDGTAVSINIYMATVPATPVTEFVCLYKGTTLIATADSSGATGSSWNEFNLTAVIGESLDFAGSDILYFGHCLEDTDQAFGYIYHDNGNTTDPMYWNNADWTSNLPPDPITLTQDASIYGMGVILKYQE